MEVTCSKLDTFIANLKLLDAYISASVTKNKTYFADKCRLLQVDLLSTFLRICQISTTFELESIPPLQLLWGGHTVSAVKSESQMKTGSAEAQRGGEWEPSSWLAVLMFSSRHSVCTSFYTDVHLSSAQSEGKMCTLPPVILT